MGIKADCGFSTIDSRYFHGSVLNEEGIYIHGAAVAQAV
jgi:hypothetical protein